jgi:hypothetical protein
VAFARLAYLAREIPLFLLAMVARKFATATKILKYRGLYEGIRRVRFAHQALLLNRLAFFLVGRNLRSDLYPARLFTLDYGLHTALSFGTIAIEPQFASVQCTRRK